MNYPVHPDDLIDEAASDEEATLIVVEAIAMGAFDELELSDPARKEELLESVTSWDGYEEYIALISSQKDFLVLPSSPSDVSLTDEQVAAMASAASRTAPALWSRVNKYVAVAASVIVLASIISIVVIVSQSHDSRSGDTSLTALRTPNDDKTADAFNDTNDRAGDTEKNALTTTTSSQGAESPTVVTDAEKYKVAAISLGSFATQEDFRAYARENYQELSKKDSSNSDIGTYYPGVTPECKSIFTDSRYWGAKIGDGTSGFVVVRDSRPSEYNVYINCDQKETLYGENSLLGG